MKISLNWLKKYVTVPETVSNDELIRLIGARLVEVEGVIDETHKYDNIFVVSVEACEKIPNTHLSLCQINVGDSELVQVVCGAPNVQVGMLAVWIAPGAIVPASVHEDAPFVIGKRKMQGYDSNGMLAGADELDFGDDHSGIVEIEPGMAKPGTLLADLFELRDLILEIENKSLTHRPDCFGIIGFAREVAGILGEKFEEPEFLTHEEIFPRGFLRHDGVNGLVSKDCDINIKITNKTLCGRYTAATIKINEEQLKNCKYLNLDQILLTKSGMKSVSQIVDMTNVLMLLTGQPLHAFDLDKFLAVGKSNAPNIIVRLARPNEKILLLDGSEINCIEDDILITSNDVPVALAGAMGGKDTEIDENTKNVLLESATFSLYNLRKTQMAHGIFTEAITRFTKGLPAGETFNVLAEVIERINAKTVAVRDVFPGWHEITTVLISVDEINKLLGANYEKSLIKRTLENVGFEITEHKDELKIIVPVWRTDIQIKEDIIEEVGRLLGYDNIAPTLPLHATADKNPMWEFKKQIRNLLSRYGANEILNYSFVSEKLLKRANQDAEDSYKIINSISPELQYERQSIVPSLLEKAYKNEKLPIDKFAIYEMNQIYRKDLGTNSENVPEMKMSLGFVVAERKNKETAFYKAKKYVAKVLEEFGIQADYLPTKEKTSESRPFEPKRSADIWINNEYLGIVGEFKNSVRNDFKLAPYLAGFEIDISVLMKHAMHRKCINLGELKHEDLTVTTDKNYIEVLDEVKKKYPNSVITPGTIYQAEDQTTKNITFHIATAK